MNKQEKKRFIKNLTGSIRDELISKIDKIPENWDGYELRQLLADSFKQEAYLKMTGKRKKDYTNNVIINNL